MTAMQQHVRDIFRIRRWTQPWPLVVGFVLLGLVWSIINPPHEATDELRHYRFVRYIVENGTLPQQGFENCRSQSHHPPLIYALGAAVTAWHRSEQGGCVDPPTNPFWQYRWWEVSTDNKNQYLFDHTAPWDGARVSVQLVRAVNIAFGALTVWLTWQIGRLIAPKRPAIALIAAGLIGFNPMFMYMAAAINNDVIAATASAYVMLLCVQINHDGNGLSRRWAVRFGIAFGLALMSKFNNAALAAPIAITLTWVAWRHRQWRLWLESGIISVAVTLLVSGWWFVRNVILYGEPTGVQRLTELWGARDPRDSLGLALSELPQAWSTLWGRFGFGQIPMQGWIYGVMLGLVLVSILGVLISLARLVSERRSRPNATPTNISVQLTDLGILAGWVGLFFAVLFNYMLISPAGAMGRFFFPGLPALVLLIAYGWHIFLPAKWRPSTRQLFGKGIVGLMLAFNLYALFGILQPAYAQPANLSTAVDISENLSAAISLSSDLNVQVEGLGTLRGYKVGARAIQPGDALPITLYWDVADQPIGNFVMFVHLRDDISFVTQRDTHPGTGSFPTSFWQAGDRFSDQVTLHIPETAYAPNAAELTIGFYAPNEGYRLGVLAHDGTRLGDAVSLGQLAINPLPNALPNAQAENFGNQLQLEGYSIAERTVSADGSINVELHWRALNDLSADYQLQMLLLDENEQYRGSADVTPGTQSWATGSTYTTNHTFNIDQLPTTITPGTHIIRIAVQDQATGEKAPRLHDTGNEIADTLDLAPVRIEE